MVSLSREVTLVLLMIFLRQTGPGLRFMRPFYFVPGSTPLGQQPMRAFGVFKPATNGVEFVDRQFVLAPCRGAVDRSAASGQLY